MQQWLALTLSVAAEYSAPAEQALFSAGAVSVEMSDAGDSPIHEPDPGEIRVWPEVRISGLFSAETDPAAVLLDLLSSGIIDSPAAVDIRGLAERDWIRAWMDSYQPMRFGQNLWICPWHLAPEPDWPVVVRLDPGLAFGSGTHPTTALCLTWIDQADLSDATIIDFGAGSGVLGIAAALKGARRVIATDHDPQALAACRDNARRNRVDDRFEVIDPAALGNIQADVVLANILASTLIELAPRLAALTRPSGQLVLSGILDEQADAVTAAYQRHFEQPDQTRGEDWVCLVLRRKQPRATPP